MTTEREQAVINCFRAEREVCKIQTETEKAYDAGFRHAASLETQLAATKKAYRSMVDANRTASERLAESGKREGL